MKRIFNDTLNEYCNQPLYPWHMPGHKRKNQYSLDVTELPGLDNLHAPEGAIAESMAQLPNIYGSRKSYYLVNGSTSGILTAVSATCNRGDTIIMSRNCHKSVYHIVALLELKPVYIYPKLMKPYDLCGSILLEQVEQALQEHPKAKAVIFPSPTYEGILSDVSRISEIVHRAGAWLIVDEAHGAHFEFGAQFPASATRCGADLIIESLHKTLPCYTQCAILHLGTGRISGNKSEPDERLSRQEEENRVALQERVERYLSIYQTSSPSYLFVANMENCIASMEEWRNTRMAEYYERLTDYRRKWANLKNIHLLTVKEVQQAGGFAYDESKLVFAVMNQDVTGEDVLQQMEDQYGMVFEMASLRYTLAMTSVADNEEDFEKLNQALVDFDQRLNGSDDLKAEGAEFIDNRQVCMVFLPGEAFRMNRESVLLEEAKNRIAGEYVTVYPPGIPILVPGERIGSEQVEYIRQCMQAGLTVNGTIEIQGADGDEHPGLKVLEKKETEK